MDRASSGPCGNTRETRNKLRFYYNRARPVLTSFPFSSCSGNRRRGPCLLNGDPSPVPPSNASRIRDVVTLSETTKRNLGVCRCVPCRVQVIVAEEVLPRYFRVNETTINSLTYILHIFTFFSFILLIITSSCFDCFSNEFRILLGYHYEFEPEHIIEILG